ncbi:hypothetical protein DBP15_20495 [Streptomyces sp. CS065A]|nr:hypothetical protein DBP15_20495 [Streptomyces sp. CS065A]
MAVTACGRRAQPRNTSNAISRRVKAPGIDTSHFSAPPRTGDVGRRRPGELLPRGDPHLVQGRQDHAALKISPGLPPRSLRRGQ